MAWLAEMRSITHHKRLSIIALLCAALPVVACGAGTDSAEGDQANQMTSKSIEEVLRDHTDEWMAIPGVVGTGIGRCGDDACIRVFVTRKTDEIADKIPAKVDGYTVDLEESGPFRAREQP